jgi:hypothetical protein
MLAGLVLLASCVSTNAVRVGNGPVRPKFPADQVVIYRTADQVPGKYEEVALLNSKGDFRYSDEEKLAKSMREKAGEMGANALILDAMSEPTTGAKVAQVLFGGAARKGHAIAIWVLPASTTPKP